MQAQKKIRNNKKQRNIKEIAYILYLLKVKGITQQDIATDLGITRQAVNRVISGKASSQKINNWLKLNLGVM